MRSRLSFRLILQVNNKKNAIVVINRLRKKVAIKDHIIQPYHKGGYVVTFEEIVESNTWPEAVVSGLTTAQTLNSGWELSGWIEEELSLITSNVSTPGVEFIQIQLDPIL